MEVRSLSVRRRPPETGEGGRSFNSQVLPEWQQGMERWHGSSHGVALLHNADPEAVMHSDPIEGLLFW